MGIRSGASHAYARNILKRYKKNVSADSAETNCLLKEFCKEILPPPNRIRAGNSMITNKLNANKSIQLVPNKLFQASVYRLFVDKDITKKYNRKENSYKNQYFCTEQAKLIYDF